jgi:metal-responsive CopG/Arc/MetJ family transcriptional regulator
MDSIVRVGVTFPSELLSDFDRLRVEMGYRSRSKAIQDTVRTFVYERKKDWYDCHDLRSQDEEPRVSPD